MDILNYFKNIKFLLDNYIYNDIIIYVKIWKEYI